MDGHEDRYQEKRYLMVEGTDGQQDKVRKEPICEEAVQASAEEKHDTEVIEIIVVQGGNQNNGQKQLGDDRQLFSDEQTPPSPDRLERQENGNQLGQEKALQIVQRGKDRLDPVGQEYKKHPVADGRREREIHDALEGHPGAFVSVLLQDTEARPAVSQEDQEVKDAPAQSRPPFRSGASLRPSSARPRRLAHGAYPGTTADVPGTERQDGDAARTAVRTA